MNGIGKRSRLKRRDTGQMYFAGARRAARPLVDMGRPLVHSPWSLARHRRSSLQAMVVEMAGGRAHTQHERVRRARLHTCICSIILTSRLQARCWSSKLTFTCQSALSWSIPLGQRQQFLGFQGVAPRLSGAALRRRCAIGGEAIGAPCR